MSRIDQALSRAQRASVPPPAPASDRAAASPWTGGLAATSLEEAPPRPVQGRTSSGFEVTPESSRRSLIDRFKPGWRERLMIAADADPAMVEQYRRLVATLFERQLNARLRSLVVTSPGPNDGKTLTALNLALVLSESYERRVLLIDADLRRPSIGQAAGLTTTRGLGESLSSRGDGTVVTVQMSERLSLLPASGPEPDPVSGLTSVRMQQLLEDASSTFEWVIVDSPPTGVAADAGLLGSMVDGTLLVIRAGVTPYAAVQQAIESIGRDRILGVVLNAVEDDEAPGYDAYYGVRRGVPATVALESTATAPRRV